MILAETGKEIRQAILACVDAEQDRWFHWVPVFIGVGIGCYFTLKEEPPLWLGAAIMLPLILAFRYLRRNNISFVLVIAMASLGLGFTAAQWRTISVEHPVLAKRIGPVSASGQIVRVEALPKAVRVTLRKSRLTGVALPVTPDLIRLTLRGKQPPLMAGVWIQVRAVLTPPPPPAMPGSFDFQRRFYFMEIGATGFAMGRAKILKSRENFGFSSRLTLWIDNLRQKIGENVRNHLPGNTGTVAAALMTGDRSSIPKGILDAVRDSGLAHLLAISGLHIGLIAGLLLFSIRACLALVPSLALSYPIKKWAAAAAIIGSFCYAIIAGATIPTQRAFLMISLVLLAVMTDRRGISMRSVALAATIILLIKPESLLGASFQLSFAAVVALIAVYETLQNRVGTGDREGWFRKPVRYLGGIALTTFVAGMATAPFTLFHFNQIAQFGLFANVIAVPITALLIMPCAVLAFVLMPIGLEVIGLAPMEIGIAGVIFVAQSVAGWGGAVVSAPAMSMVGVSAIALGGLWLCLWRQTWRYGGGIAIVIGLLTVFFHQAPDILIDDKGKLFAVTGKSGHLILSSRRRSSFAGDVWLRRIGQNTSEKPRFPKAGYSADGLISCDIVGCIYRKSGRIIALVTDPRALFDDCRNADIIVSAVPVRRRCPSATRVIDKFDLWLNGAHAVWLSDGGVRVKSVNDLRGSRPWVHQKTPKGSSTF